MSTGKTVKRLDWEIAVPLATNRVVLHQLAMIILIPAGLVSLLLVVLGIIEDDPAQIRFAVGLFAILTGILLILILAAILLVLNNRMHMAFVIDEAGIHSLVTDKRAKFSRTLAILLGFLTMNPTLAGAGLIAHGNRGRATDWHSIKRIEVIKDQRTIVLKGKTLTLDAIFCNEDNFDEVRATIRGRTGITK